MTTPSMDTEGNGDQESGTNVPEPPPNYDGIDFDSIFNNRDPDGFTRRQ